MVSVSIPWEEWTVAGWKQSQRETGFGSEIEAALQASFSQTLTKKKRAAKDIVNFPKHQKGGGGGKYLQLKKSALKMALSFQKVKVEVQRWGKKKTNTLFVTNGTRSCPNELHFSECLLNGKTSLDNSRFFSNAGEYKHGSTPVW